MEKQKSKKQKQLIKTTEAVKSRNNSPNDKHNKEKKAEAVKNKNRQIQQEHPRRKRREYNNRTNRNCQSKTRNKYNKTGKEKWTNPQ